MSAKLLENNEIDRDNLGSAVGSCRTLMRRLSLGSRVQAKNVYLPKKISGLYKKKH